MTFGFSDGSRNFLKLFSVSWEVFVLHGKKIEPIEWLDLVPRLRQSDCFEIHFPQSRLCDLLLSSHQTFLLEALLRQCGFNKEPLSSWFATKLCNFDLFGSVYKHCASSVPLLKDVPNLSPEKCLRVQALLYLRDFSVNSSNHSGRSRKRSSEARVVSLFLFLCWVFRWLASVSWCRIVTSLWCECCGGDVEDELVPEVDDTPGTAGGTNFSVLHKSSSRVWWGVAFDHLTHS